MSNEDNPGDYGARTRGPLAALETPQQITTLSYPYNIGSDEQLKYVLRIRIFKRIGSIFKQDVITNGFDFEKSAGASKNTNYDFGGGLATATAYEGGKTVIDNLSKGAKKGSTKAIAGIAGAAVKTGEAAAPLAAALVAAGGSMNLQRKTETQAAAYIHLYMPDSLVFSDQQDYDAVSMVEALGTAGRLSQGNSTEIAGRVAEGGGNLGGGFTEAALAESNLALNPQVEILFKGTKNREFQFQFKFIARNAAEGLAIENIIRTLRFHAAPEYSAGSKDSRYFKPPSEFDIEYMVLNNGNLEHNKRLPRIAQSVLTMVDTNYASSGQFVAFTDGMPVEILVQLRFSETVVLTKEDIQIGY
jgi:hypothetical protein